MSCSTNCFALQQKILDFSNNNVTFSTSCDIAKSTTDQISSNAAMTTQVNAMITEISQLQNNLDNLNELNNSNKTMKEDFVSQYNFQYLQNFCIFVGIILILVMFFKLFKPDDIASIVSSPNPISVASDSVNNLVKK